MFNTPVLLICFNRPRHVRRVLESIMMQEPKVLYVAQDGARDGREDDALNVQAVRDVVRELTEGSKTEVHTLYQEKNLGCGPGPKAAIDWFFENVDQGIVIEDDCLPHLDFFSYCEELLNKYKSTNVRFINSTLYDERWGREFVGKRESYGFSRYMVTGAWAAWRETWQGFDLDLKNLNCWQFAWVVYKLTGNLAEAERWWYIARQIKADTSRKSYWDYQMQIHLFRMQAVTIHPRVNLISNIGFDAEGTHTLGNDGRGNREVYPILPLVHQDSVLVNKKEDARCWAKKQSKGLIKDALYCIFHLFAWRNRRML